MLRINQGSICFSTI